MFCEKCGREIAEGSGFCVYCGAKIGANPRSAGGADVPPMAVNPTYDPGYDTASYARPDMKRIAKIIAMIAVPVVIIAVIVTLYILNTDAHKIQGEWELMSGNMYDSAGTFPGEIDFESGGNVTLSTYGGEYDVTEEEDGSGNLEIDAGIYDNIYKYSLNYGENDGAMLIIKEYNSENGTGDVGIYVNLEDADDETQDNYYYAISAYAAMDATDLYDYLEGHWSSADDAYDSGVAFALTDSDEKIDGHNISYTLGVPEHDDDELFDVDGNLITIGGLNAFRVIPISADSAYFYCYADDVLVQLDRMDE